MSDRENPTPAEDAREQGYEAGRKMAWLTVLTEAMRQLGDEKPDAARLMAERALAIQTLRRACAEFGDNGWPDELHLSDIIDKHLVRYFGS